MEPVTLTPLQFDNLHRLITATLDNAVLDNDDAIVESMTKALGILDAAQFDDAAVDVEEAEDFEFGYDHDYGDDR